ncbi:Uncharacterised protein [Zhongshania aliphaticivorans]|uniref:Uncharacterized protein n=1 Tax=Zhongshania aliphaticivorans TaxID=1470434 RepID=A0A5S9MQI1_9GAMM|nr:Uncharacterised protein [Zhongshania aliphaticivorans]CAA0086353.1 Uncharacterised protein [Zhongshania aliphaticivorans]
MPSLHYAVMAVPQTDAKLLGQFAPLDRCVVAIKR